MKKALLLLISFVVIAIFVNLLLYGNVRQQNNRLESNEASPIDLPIIKETGPIEPDELNGKTNAKLQDWLNKAGKITTQRQPEYAEGQLAGYSKDAFYMDYISVAEQFVENEFKEDLVFVYPIPGQVNPKKVIAVTKDEKAYFMQLRRWHEYDGIWTVYSYASLDDESILNMENPPEYKLMEMDESPQYVQDWARKMMKDSKQGVFVREPDDGQESAAQKLYVLITAPPDKSIEIIEINGKTQHLFVHYALESIPFTFKDYVLIETESNVNEISTREEQLDSQLFRLYFP